MSLNQVGNGRFIRGSAPHAHALRAEVVGEPRVEQLAPVHLPRIT